MMEVDIQEFLGTLVKVVKRAAQDDKKIVRDK